MAKDNVQSFAVGLKAWHQQQVADANRFKRVLALLALGGVVKKSPVDTGRFRANWQVSTSRPATGEVGKDGDAFDQSAGDAAAARHQAANQGAIAALQPGQSAFIANNLPYAGRLEGGHSGQAPVGMVAVTVAELELIRPAQTAGGR